jgi:hypothetical protein
MKIAIVGLVTASALVGGLTMGSVANAFTPRGEHGQNSQPQPLVDLPETAEPAPEVTTRREQTVEVVPYDSTTVDDPTRDVGDDAVTTVGVDGERTVVWLITLTDGTETGREQVSATVTTPPVTEVTSIGTRVPPPPKPAKSNCDPNYSGACVPIASDVDCAGGSGNGPAYVSGPVRVVGRDIYELDRDGDGIACD